MRIAVASDNTQVAGHFGHCEQFWFFDVEDGAIVKKEAIANPGHRPGFLPVFLNDQGANVIISGGMGGGAISLFDENNIKVVVGASGDAEAVAKRYIAGDLESTGSACDKHEHADECH